jgi:hypothetical protein
VRTEITVERQGMTLLVGGAAAGLDNCPLCGQKLTPVQTEQARLRLQQGSVSQEDLPTDGASPMSSGVRDEKDFEFSRRNKEHFMTKQTLNSSMSNNTAHRNSRRYMYRKLHGG